MIKSYVDFLSGKTSLDEHLSIIDRALETQDKNEWLQLTQPSATQLNDNIRMPYLYKITPPLPYSDQPTTKGLIPAERETYHETEETPVFVVSHSRIMQCTVNILETTNKIDQAVENYNRHTGNTIFDFFTKEYNAWTLELTLSDQSLQLTNIYEGTEKPKKNKPKYLNFII
jgi:hypothetical protein